MHTFGLVSGSIKLAKALRGGVENLRPEEADLIMRHLKKGSIGAAVLLISRSDGVVISRLFLIIGSRLTLPSSPVLVLQNKRTSRRAHEIAH